MNTSLQRSAFVVVALLMGVINPLILVAPTLKLTNPLWNSLFGLGWLLMEWLFGPAPLQFGGWQSIFGLAIWPAAVCVGLAYLTRSIGRLEPRPRTGLAFILWASFLVVVPLEMLIGGRLSWLPTYAKYFLIFS